MSHQRPEDLNRERFQFLKRLGVEAIEVRLNAEDATREKLEEIVETVSAAGLELHEIMLEDMYNSTPVVLGLPEQEEHLERFLEFIRDLGDLNVPHTTYAWHTGGMYETHRDLTRGDVPTRGFSTALAKAAPPLVDRAYSEEELWTNYQRYMERVLPVAKKAGVKLQLHPNDPPMDHQGIPRIFKSTDAFRRAMKIADDSPNSGILFCVGTFGEMTGADGGGENIVEAIHEFGAKGQILMVHMRNVTNPLPDFSETFPDEGYLDMFAIIDALVDVGFEGLLVPDHVPGDEHEMPINEAYTLGYLRALLQYAESRRH